MRTTSQAHLKSEGKEALEAWSKAKSKANFNSFYVLEKVLADNTQQNLYVFYLF